MKLSIYLDTYQWSRELKDFSVSLIPYKKSDIQAKRYRIDVEIPDPAEPDAVINAITKEE